MAIKLREVNFGYIYSNQELSKMKSKKELASICLTSQQSGWSDHFATMIDGISKTEYLPTVYTSKDAAKSFDLVDCNRVNLLAFDYSKKNIKKSLAQLYKIAKDINSKNFDAVFFYGESPQHLFILLLTKGSVVAHIADPNPHNGVSLFGKILFQITHIAYLVKSQKVFFASKSVLDQFTTKYQWLTKFAKYKRKLGTVRFANLVQFNNKINAQNESGQKLWDFIYFGRDEPYKGLDILIESTKFLKSLGKNPCILIVSRNFERENIPDNFVVIKDYLSHEDLSQYIAKSKWGVFPYTDATGTHTVQICNKYGIPVLATHVGSFNDYIVEGVNGTLVEVGDSQALAHKMFDILNNDLTSLSESDLQKWADDYFANTKSTVEFQKIIREVIC